jgi:predicted membrane protein
MRTSGYIVSPYVYDLFLESGQSFTDAEDVSTPGFAALAVDTGIIGLLLIFSLLVSFLKTYRQQHKADLFILFAPMLFVLHLFVMNISNVMLLYLAFMPYGLYLALGKSKSDFSKN